MGYAVCSRYTVRSRYAVGTQYAVGVSAKRSNPTQCAVGVSAKRSYGWLGPLPLVQKGQTPHAVGMQYAVGTQCTVGISGKRSTGTVDLANMAGGDSYL